MVAAPDAGAAALARAIILTLAPPDALPSALTEADAANDADDHALGDALALTEIDTDVEALTDALTLAENVDTADNEPCAKVADASDDAVCRSADALKVAGDCVAPCDGDATFDTRLGVMVVDTVPLCDVETPKVALVSAVREPQ